MAEFLTLLPPDNARRVLLSNLSSNFGEAETIQTFFGPRACNRQRYLCAASAASFSAFQPWMAMRFGLAILLAKRLNPRLLALVEKYRWGRVRKLTY